VFLRRIGRISPGFARRESIGSVGLACSGSRGSGAAVSHTEHRDIAEHINNHEAHRHEQLPGVDAAEARVGHIAAEFERLANVLLRRGCGNAA
jgi:hypothetical protein